MPMVNELWALRKITQRELITRLTNIRQENDKLGSIIIC